MAENPKNLNLAYQETVANPTSGPSLTGSDCIVLRFELEDFAPLSQCVQELLFNSVMQEESKGRPAYLIQRAPRERCIMGIIWRKKIVCMQAQHFLQSHIYASSMDIIHASTKCCTLQVLMQQQQNKL